MAGINITLVGRSRLRWLVHAGLDRGAGRESGLTLTAGGVAGLMDAPIETDWTEDTSDGSVFSGERFLPRDMDLGFAFSDELAKSRGGEIESQFRLEFGARQDRWDPGFTHTKVEVESELSGVRWLEVQLREQPDMKMELDPYSREVYEVAYGLRAGQPLWQSKKKVTEFEVSGASGSGFIEISNPSDTEMRHTWVLTQGDWVLPDPSWTSAPGKRVPGGEFPTRTVPVKVLAADGGARITRERRKLHAQTFTGANLLGRMNGVWVKFDIPPHTPKTLLPISVANAPAGGARAELHQPRFWSRPVGMEL